VERRPRILASPFRPRGHERSSKSAPQHAPTVVCNFKTKNMKTFLTLGILLLCINIFGQDCFEIGSSQNTVKNIQGTPSSINDYNLIVVWSYGSSSVTFENGKVKSYNNLSKNLKICETDNFQKYSNQNNTRKQIRTATNKIDSKFGIRDIQLESTFSSISNIYTLTYEKIYSSDKYDCYSIEGFDRFLGDDIIITNINLDFIDNELYRINLSIDCDKAVTRLTKLIEKSYGKLEEDTESHDYFIKGNKAALYYSVRGNQLSNGYIKSFANISILSLRLRKKFLGTTGF
jgi:hypothetical protein